MREMFQADFDAYDISEQCGFLLEDPLTNLPEYYQVWMDLANNITHLLETRKLRDMVHQIPVLSPHLLSSHRELRLAHLALGFITMGYVWQEGKHAPAQTLPKAVAWPYWLISHKLGLPPILTYADIILANWKLRDPTGDLEIGNMDAIFSFPGSETYQGFVCVSILTEMAASSGIKGSLEVVHALKFSDLTGIQRGLITVTQSLKKIKETFKLMHNHVDPTVFYGTLRIFFSGWRDNPMLPHGLLYDGVSNDRIMLSGGSAAQSSSLQCFDALLCIQHDGEPGAFLKRMRDYMPPAHRQLIEHLSLCPSLRDFIQSRSSRTLCQAYNECVSALVELRNYHFNIVAKYIIIPSNHGYAKGCPFSGGRSKNSAAGTSGSNFIVFLKSVRNTTKEALISEQDLHPENIQKGEVLD